MSNWFMDCLVAGEKEIKPLNTNPDKNDFSKEAMQAECDKINARSEERLAEATERWKRNSAANYNKKVRVTSDGFLLFGGQEVPIKFIEGIIISVNGSSKPPHWYHAWPCAHSHPGRIGITYAIAGGYVCYNAASVISVIMTSGRKIEEQIDARQSELYLADLITAWKKALK